MLDSNIIIMDGRDHKESLNLLQNSENLSLSDLELPEIEHQRKRKVRRKTRPKLGTARQRTPSTTFGHKNIILLGTVFFITSCWLLILSYTMSVIHIENQRLQSEIKKGINKPLNNKGKNSPEKLIRTSTDEQEEFLQAKNYQNSEKCRVKKYVPFRMCVPLIVLVFMILLFGIVHWLYFDVRQQFIEYRQKIEEVSVISQNLPEEMQKWHEKSSFLEKNQSIIYEKLNELQIAVESLKANLTKYAARVDTRNDYSKDDKFVADLGAKLEAVASDMKTVKDRITVVQNNQSRLQEDIDKLGVRFSDISNHIPEKSKDQDECLQKIETIKTNYESEIKGINANISLVNDTLTQKTHILSEELLTHKTKLDDLLDKSANITSHVTSIKNDWTKYRQQIVDCEVRLDNFVNNITEVTNKTTNLEKSLQEIRLNQEVRLNLNNEISRNNHIPMINTTQDTKVETQTDFSKPVE